MAVIRSNNPSFYQKGYTMVKGKGKKSCCGGKKSSCCTGKKGGGK